MKKLYRVEYPWYYILVLFVVFGELLFLIYSVVSLKESDSIEFIHQNVAVNVVLLIIILSFLKSLIEKKMLFEYNKELIKDNRRDIELMWENIKDFKIEKNQSNSDISLNIDYVNNDYNYVLNMTTNDNKNYSILLGKIGFIKRKHISHIIKKYMKKSGKK